MDRMARERSSLQGPVNRENAETPQKYQDDPPVTFLPDHAVKVSARQCPDHHGRQGQDEEFHDRPGGQPVRRLKKNNDETRHEEIALKRDLDLILRPWLEGGVDDNGRSGGTQGAAEATRQKTVQIGPPLADALHGYSEGEAVERVADEHGTEDDLDQARVQAFQQKNPRGHAQESPREQRIDSSPLQMLPQLDEQQDGEGKANERHQGDGRLHIQKQDEKRQGQKHRSETTQSLDKTCQKGHGQKKYVCRHLCRHRAGSSRVGYELILSPGNFPLRFQGPCHR